MVIILWNVPGNTNRNVWRFWDNEKPHTLKHAKKHIMKLREQYGHLEFKLVKGEMYDEVEEIETTTGK